MASTMSSQASPLLPAEFRTAVLAELEKFFAKPEVCGEAGAFSSASPTERALAVADCLCGAPASVQALGGAPTGAGSAPRKRRIFFNGCFDLMHVGHYNGLRQAKAAFPGDEVTLVAGVHSDEAIQATKGAPTVYNHAERLELTEACRWVDEVVGELPYTMPVSLLDQLDCEVVVHGDDLPKVSSGTGLYDEVIAANRMHIVKRTEGTSTTMLIGRLLSMSKEHLLSKTLEEQTPKTSYCVGDVAKAAPPIPPPSWMLLPTMSRMSLFYGERARKLADAKRVVYAPGEWDLFHIGHVRFLKKARELGDFVLVGIYDDETVNRRAGKNFPLQTLHERSLSVLANRYADDVLLGAPWRITQDLMTTLNVSVVVTGGVNAYRDPPSPEGLEDPAGLGDPFEVPRASNSLQVLEPDSSVTMEVIAERIREHTGLFSTRQEKKERADQEYTEGKAYVAEA